MALVVLDASVLIAYLDPDDAHHRRAWDAVVERLDDALILPMSAYAEVLVGPVRRGAKALRHVEGMIDEAALRLEPIGRTIAREAARLRAQHGWLPLPHALVLATGTSLAADEILTADRAWARVSRIVVAIG